MCRDCLQRRFWLYARSSSIPVCELLSRTLWCLVRYVVIPPHNSKSNALAFDWHKNINVYQPRTWLTPFSPQTRVTCSGYMTTLARDIWTCLQERLPWVLAMDTRELAGCTIVVVEHGVWFRSKDKNWPFLEAFIMELYVNPTPKQPFSWIEDHDTGTLRKKIA